MVSKIRQNAMRVKTRISAALLALVLSGCGAVAGGNPSLDCAAYISASTYLHMGGKIQLDAEIYNQGLFSLGMYTAKYAVPNGVSEAEATALIKARRQELIEGVAPEAVKRRATACVRKVPRR